MSDQQKQNADADSPRLRRWLLAILLAAVALRVAAVWHWRSELTNDRDGYGKIAAHLAGGNGYSSDGKHPTAFRPPLYPLFLAVAGEGIAVAVAQILLGSLTVWLTFVTGRRLASPRVGVIAAALVAVDPLLLAYTPQLMTETLFTFLVALLLCGWRAGRRQPPGDSAGPGSTRIPLAGATSWRFRLRVLDFFRISDFEFRVFLLGFVFGLCALCRPSIWAFGGLAAVIWLLTRRKERGRSLRAAATAVAAAAVTVAPWVVRNAVSLGRPILLTTHGGYTLLLGNNPVFAEEVVRQPAGTVWARDSLIRWQQSLEVAMRHAEPPPRTEPERDRWMRERAVRNIRNDPGGFTAACWLRFRRFWSVAPSSARQNLSHVVLWGVGLFYTLLFAGMLLGTVRVARTGLGRWWPLLALIAAFTGVHLFYWSNARMRAPLMPAIALLAAAAVAGGRSNRRD